MVFKSIWLASHEYILFYIVTLWTKIIYVALAVEASYTIFVSTHNHFYIDSVVTEMLYLRATQEKKSRSMYPYVKTQHVRST